MASPQVPRPRSLVAIRSRHACQCSNALTISSLSSLLSDLSSSHAAHSRDDRIAAFRQDWLLGLLARTRPLELVPHGHEETYSDGMASPASSLSSSAAPPPTSSRTPLVVAAAAASARSVLPSTPTPTPTPDDDDVPPTPLVPHDALSRGVLFERTLKRHLALSHQLVRHRDFASLASAARRAMRLALSCPSRPDGPVPVYLACGLVDSVDWTREYRERGWAAPGVRWGVLRPDLVRFVEVEGKGKGKKGGVEEGDRVVEWEVVEVKWVGKQTDFTYTNWKIQAGFYHLTLSRLLSQIPNLVPSHKLTFFISHDPHSAAAYTERSVALRTTMAFVEHHLFVLVPRWLDAVTVREWDRLQDGLRSTPQTPTRTAGAPTLGASTAAAAAAGPHTFLEKLQASIAATPPTPGRARRRPPSPIKPALALALDPSSSPSPSPSPFAPFAPLLLPSSSPSTLPNPSPPTLPSPSPPTLPSPMPPALVLDALPPLPPPDLDEERDLLADWLEGVALST